MPLPLFYHPSVRRDDIPRLHPLQRSRIHRALRERVAVGPARCGKPLGGTLKGLWSLRVGDYRVIYSIAPDRVRVLKIGHRREVYREALRRLLGREP